QLAALLRRDHVVMHSMKEEGRQVQSSGMVQRRQPARIIDLVVEYGPAAGAYLRIPWIAEFAPAIGIGAAEPASHCCARGGIGLEVIEDNLPQKAAHCLGCF